MKTDLTRPLTFFILGVPRSGTTILCNLFNALEDGFCVGEPHWKGQTVRKASRISLASYFHFVIELPAKIKPECNIAGYKETYRPGHELSEMLVDWHLPFVDFFLIVFRDPVLAHSSQRALGWTEWDTPDDFNTSYQRLDQLAQHEKGIAVVYEDFVESPLEYLNQRLPFNITGPVELKPTGHAFGDPFANRSTEIVVSKREVCLTQDEIKAHEPGREIWRKWR